MPQDASGPPARVPAVRLDGPLDCVLRDVWLAEAQQREGPEDDRVVAQPDERERQRAQRVDVGVAERLAAEPAGHGNRVARRDPTRIPGDHTHIFVSVAKLEFSVSGIVRTTAERALDYFADYRHVCQALEGVSRWAPIVDQPQSACARNK